MTRYTLPYRLGAYRGKAYKRFTVYITQSGLDPVLWLFRTPVEIVASSPDEACNAIRDEVAPLLEHPAEFTCAGMRGGITSRFIGWESLVAHNLFYARHDNRQLELAL